ncbi:MAG TPA: class I SAM-dependent methyltransferase [Armatimonadota bacterium]|jgi:SAM-dependent methyltransferase
MTDPFASVAETYDIMIDWPARLARERPFVVGLFAERKIARVLDVGCGTGHHSRLFAELGAAVVGLDPSLAMLQRARALTEGSNPQFVLGGFSDFASVVTDTYDLIVVLGNTLAYAKDADDLTAILRQLRQALAPAGRLCLQVVNYDGVLHEASRWLPLVHKHRDGREYLFLREYRRMGAQVEFTLTTLTREGEWQRATERSLHYAITGEALSDALTRAGFVDFTLYGDYARTPYDPATSPSLVALAQIG